MLFVKRPFHAILAALLAVLPLAAAQAKAPAAPPDTHMVATANPHATEAGLEILRAGGSATDAAIAIQLVLTLVEPQSSGIGGGAFMLHYDTAAGETLAYDGRETAPADVDETLFLKTDGTPEDKGDMMPGGRSVGVPGVIAMMGLAHERHGKLPWARLFDPAIRLASDGFAVSPRLHMLIGRDKHLKKFDTTRAYFFTAAGAPLPTGHVLKNPAYADTLRLLAENGPTAFYRGALAEEIVETVQTAPINPGTLSLDDMAAYEPKVRAPVCGDYREWKVCGMPPPSSGGVAVLQILKLLEGFDLPAVEPESAEALNLMTEAYRLAYADRATWLADTDFVPVPVKGLIDDSYIETRRALITPGQIMEEAPAGTPPGATETFETAPPGEVQSTTHYSVIDQWGNTVALTSSVENAFGNRMMVGGFLLNNQLTDFTFAPEEDGKLVANRVAPGKRPLSSMSPTLVFDGQGRPLVSLGSPGGPLIIGFVAKTLIGVLDWTLPVQDAIELSNVFYFNNSLFVERGGKAWDAQPALEKMGYTLREAGFVSGIQGIVVHYDDAAPDQDAGLWLDGGTDPRREGTVGAD